MAKNTNEKKEVERKEIGRDERPSEQQQWIIFLLIFIIFALFLGLIITVLRDPEPELEPIPVPRNNLEPIPKLPTNIRIEAENIQNQDGNIIVGIDALPDQVKPEPSVTFGGPTHFTHAILSDNRRWIAIGNAGMAHSHG